MSAIKSQHVATFPGFPSRPHHLTPATQGSPTLAGSVVETGVVGTGVKGGVVAMDMVDVVDVVVVWHTWWPLKVPWPGDSSEILVDLGSWAFRSNPCGKHNEPISGLGPIYVAYRRPLPFRQLTYTVKTIRSIHSQFRKAAFQPSTHRGVFGRHCWLGGNDLKKVYCTLGPLDNILWSGSGVSTTAALQLPRIPWKKSRLLARGSRRANHTMRAGFDSWPQLLFLCSYFAFHHLAMDKCKIIIYLIYLDMMFDDFLMNYL